MDNLTVIIPFYQGHATLHRLLDSLPSHLPVIIVDDISDPPLLRERWMGEHIKILRPSQKGYFTGAVNVGMQACHTDVLVLNQDVWFESNEWTSLIDKNRSKFAMIGERILGTHPAFGDRGYIHGTFMFLRRDAIGQTGFLNASDYPLWGSTAEYQWRVARRGFESLPVVHIPGFKHERATEDRYGSSIQALLKKEPDKKSLFVRTPPLLSVIVPCYNYGRYIADCIHSLIGGPTSLGYMPGQTLQSFEIIIVDDASTDDSPQYIAAVVDREKGIRSYRLEQNQGTARTLNYGIERANGQYITFLSADDMREPESLEALVRTCQSHPHSFAYDDVMLFHRDKRLKEWEMQEYDFDELIYRNQIHAGIVFPKRAWEEVGGYPAMMDNGREDWAFNVSLGVHGWCGEHVRQFGYLYRRENQNRSLTNTSPWHHERFLAKIKSLFPAIYRGERTAMCCGKPAAPRKTSSATMSMQSLAAKKSLTTNTILGGMTMAASAGTNSMVKLEYVGRAMSSVWDGPVTNIRYRFGKDRPTGWVDRRDVGVKGTSGFLNVKDRNNNYLFRVIEEGAVVKKTVAQPVAESVSVVVTEAEEPTTIPEAEPTVAVSKTLVAEKTVSVEHPDPSELNATEIRALELTTEQWRAVYEDEMAADRPRKGVITFIEEKLAGE